MKQITKAVEGLERVAKRIQKRLAGYEDLLMEQRTIQRAIAALKGTSSPAEPEEGMDGGGVHHVVKRGRRPSKP